jgi:hypothetical protein
MSAVGSSCKVAGVGGHRKSAHSKHEWLVRFVALELERYRQFPVGVGFRFSTRKIDLCTQARNGISITEE